MRTQAVSSSPRAHSILLTCRCTSSVREARKPLRDNNHGQTASHLCQEFWTRGFPAPRRGMTADARPWAVGDAHERWGCLDPDTGILRNLVGAQTWEELRHREDDFVEACALELLERPVVGVRSRVHGRPHPLHASRIGPMFWAPVTPRTSAFALRDRSQDNVVHRGRNLVR